MKKHLFFIVLALVPGLLPAQSPETDSTSRNLVRVQARLKGGLGQTITALPMKFTNVTIQNPLRQQQYVKGGLENDFLRTKWGGYGGLTLDLFLNPVIGFGLDADYFGNRLEFIEPERLSTYRTEEDIPDLVEANRKNQTLWFVGLGPAFKLLRHENLEVDLNIRGGLSLLNMGSLNVSFPHLSQNAAVGTARLREEIMRYDYQGLDASFGLKAGLSLNYWFSDLLGLTAGIDFIHTFMSPGDMLEHGNTLFYKDPKFFEMASPGGFDSFAYLYINNPLDEYLPRTMNINHVSASVGLIFRIEAGGAADLGGSSPEEAIPPQQVREGKTFILKNIYYDFDKCDFRSDAIPELNMLVDFLLTNPTIEIELSSHTDQRGDDAYNLRLSQCRAESVVNYLVANGINRTRIKAVGYGETKLLFDCTTDPECGQNSANDCPCHKANRRTEVKILKM